jgi:dynein light intermediate chain 2
MSKGSSSGSVEDIWTKLQRHNPQQTALETASISTAAAANEDESGTVNTHAIYLGDQSCGKSSLIQTLLKPSAAKETKPTIALDYNYARKTSNNIKYIAHIWELGGDLIEPKLLDIPISKQSLPTAAAIITCDASKPHNVVVSILRSLSALKDVVNRRASEIQATNAQHLNEYRERLQAIYKAHADSNRVRPLDIQTVIVLNKADALRTLPVSERRCLWQIIRFIAHYFGATVISMSTQDSQARETYRNLINSFCFASPMKSLYETAPTGEGVLAISRGCDSFEAILQQNLDAQQASHRLVNDTSDMELFLTHKGVSRDCWNRLTQKAAEVFGEADPLPTYSLEDGRSGQDDFETGQDPHGGQNNENPFPETEVDDIRSARDAQLQRFVQEQERRQEMIAKMR